MHPKTCIRIEKVLMSVAHTSPARRVALWLTLGFSLTTHAATPPIIENFDTWTTTANWSTIPNSNGWLLVDGQIKPTRGGFAPPRSLPNAAWLRSTNASSSLRSPLLPDGAESINFWACKYPSGTATSTVAVQFTTNLTDWETLAAITITSDTWTACANIPGTYRAGYLRLAQLNATSTNLYTGLDDLTLAFDPVTTPINPTNSALRQLLPSSRRTPLILSEIMYHPPDTNPDLEFIELFNTEPVSLDISSFRLSGDIAFTFPTNTRIAARSFLVIAQNPAALQAAYNLPAVFGPYTNTLPNDSGRLRLRNEQNAVLLEIDYSDQAPWSAAADGAGHSLHLANPDYGEGDPRAWSASALIGGSPGSPDPDDHDRLDGLVINEFLAHTDLPDIDFIELLNATAQPLDISGCWLSDTAETNKFRIPDGMVLPPGGRIAYTQTQLGFSLSSHGDDIVLRNPRNTRVLDAITFPAQANGVASGRFPDGAPTIHELQQPTSGTNNAPLRIADIVINEIMYSPISGNDADEYIELFNRGTQTVSLANWRFVSGIDFAFPPGVTLAPGTYIIIARDMTNLLARYPQLNPANTLGDFRGQLSDRGERLALAKPDNPALPYEDVVIVDDLTYADGWGPWSDGGGSSLELIDPRSDNRLGPNWAASDESQKAPWTTVAFTGRVDNGIGSIIELQIIGLQSGEFLLDNVELVREGDTLNRITNPGFESGLSGWFLRGNHVRSSLRTTEGFASANSLHVRASDRGDITYTGSAWTFYDQVATFPSPAPTANERFTLRAKARWLCGYPHMLLGLQGFWLEAAGRLELPPNLGTPGLPNSRATGNAPPAISAVTHSPLLPAAAQPVRVSARLHDPDGIAAAWLSYRIDPSTNRISTPMTNDGSGFYSALIPGQSSGTVVAFRIGATDSNAAPASGGFPQSAASECLVRVGDAASPGVFGAYRLWLAAANQTLWNTRLTHDNEPIDLTFVVDGARAIYNGGGHYRGGWRTNNGPAGSDMCAFNLEMPKAERVLGDNEVKLDMTGFDSDDGTRQAERFSFWVARQLRHPYANLRLVNVWVNGVLRQPLHDYQVPSQDFVQSWYPGEEDPPIFKQETQDALTLILTDDGAYKQSRYRDVWRPRKPKAPSDDLQDVYARVAAFNLPYGDAYHARTSALADLESWIGYFGVNHVLENIDSWGYDLHHNAFLYLSRTRPGLAFLQDTDFSMYPRYTTAAHHDPFFNDDPVTARLFNYPPFRRAYWRLLKEAVNGPLLPANYNPVFDELDAAMTANAMAHTSPVTLKSWLADRRSYLLPMLDTVAAPFAITSNGGADFSTNAPSTTLGGTAPVEISDIRINGASFPLTFPTVTNWSTTVPLQLGTNALTVQGYDRFNNLIASDTITVTATVPPPDPTGWIVISEIMHHAPIEHADYLEIFNRATNTTFNLSGARLNGLDFTFPPGTFIRPRESRVIADNLTTYTLTYTNAETVIAAYDGELDNGGETLTLQLPGATTNDWIDIDTVHYDDDLPWPAEAAGQGQSLQLLDPDQDNNRAGNWGVASPAPAATWQFRSVTGVVSNATPGTLTNATLSLYLQSAASVRLDNLMLVTGAVAGVGANLLANGDFENTLSGPWAALGNHSGSGITSNAYAGVGALQLAATAAGAPATNAVVQNRPLTNMVGTTLTLSYWYLQTNTAATLAIHLTSSGIITSHGLTPIPPTGMPLSTPGTTNSITSILPPFQSLWIAELMASNLTATVDNAGDHDPWLELFNAESNALALDEYFLSNDYGDLRRWPFPTNTVIGANERLLVWLDGEAAEAAPNAPHTSFAIHSVNGSVTLSRGLPDRTVVIDAINYGPLAPNTSYGSYPDSDPFNRMVFHTASPGQSNSPLSLLPALRINEWLADNTATLPDPADGRFQDWIELFNAESARVHLGGFTLTDRPASSNRFVIPGGTWIEPRSFMLIWADGQPSQNQTGRDLHVDFSLNKDGEDLALFAPDGTQLDSLTFGSSSSDASEGLWPDGAGPPRHLWWPTPGTTNIVFEIRAVSGTGSTAPAMQWPARPGHVYRVEHRNDLTGGTWQVAALITATLDSISFSDPTATNTPHRFYRLSEM